LDIISSEINEVEAKAEEIWVKINIVGNRDLYICSHYRPNISDKTSIPNFKDSLTRLGNHKAHIFIGGDFNLPDWDWVKDRLKPKAKEATKHRDFVELLHEFNLIQLVQKPTRLNNILDLMITNNPSIVNRTEILPGISDHDAVFCEIDINPSKLQQPKRQIPQYKKANWDALKEEVVNIGEEIENKKDTHTMEELWQTFKIQITEGIKQHIPHKTTSDKHHLPWLNQNIKHLISKRNRVYRAMKKSQSHAHRQTFQALKARIQRELRQSYWQYIENIVFESSEKPQISKKFYTYLKHNKTDRSGIAPLRDLGLLHTNSTDKAKILNKQFQSVFTKELPLPL
jgi:hypothetical protein